MFDNISISRDQYAKQNDIFLVNEKNSLEEKLKKFNKLPRTTRAMMILNQNRRSTEMELHDSHN